MIQKNIMPIGIMKQKKYDTLHIRLDLINQIIRKKIKDTNKKNCKLLDIGCGTTKLRQLIPKTINYFGIDICKEIIQKLNDSNISFCDLNHSKINYPNK